MGIVVTVMNMKGGVGKTTVAMHLAGVSSMYKIGATNRRKILIIDYDPQFNLSQAFLAPKFYFDLEKQRKTTIAVLLDDDTNLNPYKLQVPGNHTPPKVTEIATRIRGYTDGGCLDIVPSTLDLMYVALGQADTQLKPMEERFQKFITECKSIYDIIYIDCHPAGSLFTKTALRNSEHVVIPVVPQRYAIRGIGLMLKFMDVKQHGSTTPTPHILFNFTPRIGVSNVESTIRANPSFTHKCMTNTLKKYSAFEEPEGGKGFVWHSQKPYSTEAFRNLMAVAHELLIRIGA